MLYLTYLMHLYLQRAKPKGVISLAQRAVRGTLIDVCSGPCRKANIIGASLSSLNGQCSSLYVPEWLSEWMGRLRQPLIPFHTMQQMKVSRFMGCPGGSPPHAIRIGRQAPPQLTILRHIVPSVWGDLNPLVRHCRSQSISTSVKSIRYPKCPWSDASTSQSYLFFRHIEMYQL